MEESEGKEYHLKRFLDDVKKTSNKKRKEKKGKLKRKQIKLPNLGFNRGIFENVLLGKTCHRDYSPLQKARMNEDIFALAQNRPDEEDFLLNNINKAGANAETLKETELVEQEKANSLPLHTKEQNNQDKDDGHSAEREKSGSGRKEISCFSNDPNKRGVNNAVQDTPELLCHAGTSSQAEPFKFLPKKKSFDVLNFNFLVNSSSSDSDGGDSNTLFRKNTNQDVYHLENYISKNKMSHNQNNRQGNGFLGHSYSSNKAFKYFDPLILPGVLKTHKTHKKHYRLSPHTY